MNFLSNDNVGNEREQKVESSNLYLVSRWVSVVTIFFKQTSTKGQITTFISGVILQIYDFYTIVVPETRMIYVTDGISGARVRHVIWPTIANIEAGFYWRPRLLLEDLRY